MIHNHSLIMYSSLRSLNHMHTLVIYTLTVIVHAPLIIRPHTLSYPYLHLSYTSRAMHSHIPLEQCLSRVPQGPWGLYREWLCCRGHGASPGRSRSNRSCADGAKHTLIALLLCPISNCADSGAPISSHHNVHTLHPVSCLSAILSRCVCELFGIRCKH